MEQIVPISLRRSTMQATKECARAAACIYTIVFHNLHQRTSGRTAKHFCCRRRVRFDEFYLASAEKHSRKGSRERSWATFRSGPCAVSGKIKSGFVETGPPSTVAANHTTKSRPKADSRTKHALARFEDGSGLSKRANAAAAKRRAPRRNVLRAGRISFADESMTCTVRNISATGASVEGANLKGIPDTFTLVLEMESIARRCTVVWRTRRRLAFDLG